MESILDLIFTLIIQSLVVALLIAHRLDLFKEVYDMFKPLFRTTPRRTPFEMSDGTYSDSRGRLVGTIADGQWKWTTTKPKVGSKEWVQKPQVQEQLRGMEQLFKHEVIRAIHEGHTPPHSVGVGTHTRETLRKNWNNEWEAIAKKMGIKLFKKRKTGGPNADIWVDVKPGSELKFVTENINEKWTYRVGSNPMPFFAKPKPPPSPPPTTDRAVR